MIIEAKLEISDQTIDADFGVVQIASDGGYEKGHADGEVAGYKKGYEDALEETAADNEEIALQSELLQQISTELEGKTGTSGYEQGYEDGRRGVVDPNTTDWIYYCAFGRLADILQYSDTSKGVSFNYMFTTCDSRSKLKTVPRIDTSNGKTFINMFIYSSNIETIEELNVSSASESSNGLSNTFLGCTGLKNIRFVGTIPISINFQWSKLLSHDSIINVLNTLSTTAIGMTVTFSLEAVNNAFETSEGAADGSTSQEWLALIATRENWTVSLA